MWISHSGRQNLILSFLYYFPMDCCKTFPKTKINFISVNRFQYFITNQLCRNSLKFLIYIWNSELLMYKWSFQMIFILWIILKYFAVVSVLHIFLKDYGLIIKSRGCKSLMGEFFSVNFISKLSRSVVINQLLAKFHSQNG